MGFIGAIWAITILVGFVGLLGFALVCLWLFWREQDRIEREKDNG